MRRKIENTGFVCVYCGTDVEPLTNGSYRNHCPYCLWSIHIDNIPGDRMNDCLGLMKPIGVRIQNKKGYQVVDRCQKCGAEKVNRAAPDDMDAILELMKSEGFM